MFSPSASSIDSSRGGMSSPKLNNKNHVTSRVKRSKRKSLSNFKIPPLFSSSMTSNASPKKMTINAYGSRSRLPFSPLTNSIDRRVVRSNEHDHQSEGTSASASKSVPLKTKRVIDFSSSVTKRSRMDEASDQTHQVQVGNESTSITSISIHNDAQESTKMDNLHSKTQKGEWQVHGQQVEGEDEYEIVFPANITPSSATLESAYNQALKYGSHQKYLRSINCNELSFTEVIIPSIFKAFQDELKRMEGKAKGRKAVNVVKKIQSYRCSLKSCEEEMIYAAEKAREERKMELKKEKEERLKLEQETKEEIERQTQVVLQNERKKAKQLKERKKSQKKKEFKKNRELWKEVASSMSELLQIEKEEKLWREVDFSAFTQGIQVKDTTSAQTEEYESNSVNANTSKTQEQEEHNSVQLIVDGITTSTNRIREAIQSLPSLMEQSEVVRGDLYQQYRKNHKFDGYRAHKDPKALIRALTLD